MNKCIELEKPISTNLDRDNPKIVVLIDSQVDDWRSLLWGVKSDARVVVIESHHDGIREIERVIQQHTALETLHIVAHGEPGRLYLGSTQLNSDTVNQQHRRIQNWSTYLEQKTLILYGCEVAKGEEGQRFIRQLHQLTGAKIAAATGKVGSEDQGGSWQLDAGIGGVEPELAFNDQLLQTYSGVFAPQVSFTTSPDVLVETESTEFTFRFELSEPPPEGGVEVFVDGNVPESLNQLDLFNITTQGIQGLTPDFDNSGFYAVITEQVATMTAPIFLDDDGDAIVLDDDPNTPDDFTVTYSLLANDGGSGSSVSQDYTIAPNANSGTVSFYDTPADVPSQPDPNQPTEPTNTAPSDLLFDVNVSGDTLSLGEAWVQDPDGSEDISQVDLWLLRPDGEWVDLEDATQFTPWSGGEGWSSFNYSTIINFGAGRYTLWAQPYDQSGATGEAVTRSFELSSPGPLPNSPPSDLLFDVNVSGNTLSLSEAWVQDPNGSQDISGVDLWLLRPDGEWEDLEDVTQFTPWSGGDGWSSFNYSTEIDDGAGRYTVWAQPYDQSGATGEARLVSFEVTGLNSLSTLSNNFIEIAETDSLI